MKPEMMQKNYKKRMPLVVERLMILLLAVFALGFLIGLFAHNFVFRPDTGHAVWKSMNMIQYVMAQIY